MADEGADVGNILNRMNEIRSALNSAGNTLRESMQAYKNIETEMRVNKVHSERITKIKNTIVFPLEDIVDANTGSFGKTEESLEKARELVETDDTAKRKPDLLQHTKTMNAAGRDMSKLSSDIALVLNAMNDGVLESKLIAMLVTIEDLQRKKTRILKQILDQEIENEIKRILDGDPDRKSVV